jgi:broad specificity phosphatase PhoE
MRHLYLFRHGQTPVNETRHLYVGGRNNETPLTELGVTQAWKLGGWILRQRVKPDFIEVSPAVRARDTARYALGGAGIWEPTPHVDDRWQELSVGRTNEGKPRSEVYTEEVLAEIALKGKDFKFRYPDAESQHEVTQRSIERIDQLHHEYPGDKTGFVFGHGLDFRLVVGKFMHMNQDEVRATELDNASATILAFDTNGNFDKLLGFNINTQAEPYASASATNV